MKTSFCSRGMFTLLLFFTARLAQAQTINIYAAPNGSATASGMDLSQPVNVARAQAIARANPQKTCTIWLTNGIYPQISLGAGDSRLYAAPLTYQSFVTGGAVIQPEITLDRKNFQPIPNSIKSRIIDGTAQTKVMQMSLAGYNFPDMAEWPATFAIGKMKSPKFYKDGIPLSMSRYPANNTMIMRSVVFRGSPTAGGSFKYRDGRGRFWLKAIDDGGLYLSGNWQYSWKMDVIRTLSLNPADSTIVQASSIPNGLGGQDYPPRIVPGTEPYYAVNLVEEINAEGQYSINFKTKMLYMWVPDQGNITCAGNSRTPAIAATGVNNTRFVGIAIRGGSGNGMELTDCNNVLVAGNHISFCSGYGVRIVDGLNCVVQSNDIDSVGAGGVIITSSTLTVDEVSLKPSGNQVINNHIYSYARESFLYSAAVDIVYACGTYVAYNKIHDAPHIGIYYGGNNNILEYNEVYDVVKKYSDMGAFYKYGGTGGWGPRGNKLRYNYIHDAPMANGIYLDGYSSGDSSCYNIIEGVTMAATNGHGYFNAFANNVFINNTYPVTSMTLAATDPSYGPLYDSLKKLWTTSIIYNKAYLECNDMVGSAGRNNNYTSRIWPSFTGNVFISNPGVLSNVNDSKLFNLDGTTNASYAQTSDPFVKWNLIFQNNRKVKGILLKPITPFRVDSLSSVGAFGLTPGHDWHINRIGLHKDSYRTDLSQKTPGIDPVLTIKATSNNNFKNPGTVLLTIGVKCPNAINLLSSIQFMDNGAKLTGVTAIRKPYSFDSVAYEVQWANPAVGNHSLVLYGYDGAYWSYASNTISFKIAAPAATQASVEFSTAASLASIDSARQLVLFPNPANSQLNIRYFNSRGLDRVMAVVYDMAGRALSEKAIPVQQGMNETSIPVNGLADGIYLLMMKGQGQPVLSQRFIVHHQ